MATRPNLEQIFFSIRVVCLGLCGKVKGYICCYNLEATLVIKWAETGGSAKHYRMHRTVLATDLLRLDHK